MDQLHQAAKKQVEDLMDQNPTRKDLYEKLEALIADHNAGSHNIQESFEQIREFIESLDEEQARHVKEGLSDEELAIFDLLTKPNIQLKKKDRQLVEQKKLKTEAFKLDWRKKRQGKAKVRRHGDLLIREIYEQKCVPLQPRVRKLLGRRPE